MTREHASVVAIGGRAVMIVGASGAGKSDLALRLIDRGASLVADDYVDIAIVNGSARCSPPPGIAGRIEVREVGIVSLPFVEDAPLALVVDLDAPRVRLPHPATRTVAGAEVPLLALDARSASAPIKVELALSGSIAALD